MFTLAKMSNLEKQCSLQVKPKEMKSGQEDEIGVAVPWVEETTHSFREGMAGFLGSLLLVLYLWPECKLQMGYLEVVDNLQGLLQKDETAGRFCFVL